MSSAGSAPAMASSAHLGDATIVRLYQHTDVPRIITVQNRCQLVMLAMTSYSLLGCLLEQPQVCRCYCRCVAPLALYFFVSETCSLRIELMNFSLSLCCPLVPVCFSDGSLDTHNLGELLIQDRVWYTRCLLTAPEDNMTIAIRSQLF